MTEKPAIPTVVVETGALLTLLLGGKKGWKGYAYAKLLVDMAKKGVIRLATTDMVLGEFMGSMAPLYEEDFSGNHPLFHKDSIPKEFSMRDERIELVQELLRDNALTIIKTPAAQEYMERIQDNEELAKFFEQEKNSSSLPIGVTWPPSIQKLRETILMDPKASVSRSIRSKGSPLELASGKRHRGEVSVADAVKQLQKQNSDEQIFVLFEGTNDRGIIVQRLSSEKGDANYDLLNGKPLPRFDPNSPQFDRENAKKLGKVNFLSTKGFLAGCMYAARELKPVHMPKDEQEKWYIIQHGEGVGDAYLHIDELSRRSAKERFDRAFGEIIANVNAKGLPRSYHRYRDRHIAAMMPEKENEFFKINGVIHEAPWLNYMAACVGYEKSTERAGPLREVISDFIQYRTEQDRHADHVMHRQAGRRIDELSPDEAGDFVTGLGEASLAQLVKKLGPEGFARFLEGWIELLKEALERQPGKGR